MKAELRETLGKAIFVRDTMEGLIDGRESKLLVWEEQTGTVQTRYEVMAEVVVQELASILVPWSVQVLLDPDEFAGMLRTWLAEMEEGK